MKKKLKSLWPVMSRALFASSILLGGGRADAPRCLMIAATTDQKMTQWVHNRVLLAVLAIWKRLKAISGTLPKRTHMLHEPGWLKILKLLAKLGYVTLKCRLLRLKGLYLRIRLRQADRKVGVLLDDNRALVVLQRETLLKYDSGTVLVDELLQCDKGIQVHDLNSLANVRCAPTGATERRRK